MDFIHAVTRNDVEKVRHMLQSNMVDVNSSFLWNSKNTYSPVIPSEMRDQTDLLQTDQKYQCKPLNIAVLGGHANMVRLLLSAGADINNKDSRGRTALVCAIYGLDIDASNINTSNLHLISQTHPAHFDIMKNILLCHPNLYYATLDGPQYEIKGITPLCLASYLGKADLIQILLEDGRVNVDGTDSKNATALMYAARDGNAPIVKILLSYHASPDITDSHGWSAIQFAEKNPEIVLLCEEVLRSKRAELSVNVSNSNGISAKENDKAQRVNYPINHSKLSILLNTMPNYPSSLSHLQFNTLKDLNPLDPSAQPLIQIVQTAFLEAIKIHDHLSLQALLMKPPNLVERNKNNEMGENLYSESTTVPIVDTTTLCPFLVNYHDPKTGLTALHHAMRTKPLPSLKTITMLFQAGADMNAQTFYGRTALHHLARFGLDKDGVSWGIQKSNSNSNGHSNKESTSSITSTQQLELQSTKPVVSKDMADKNRLIAEHLALCASLLIRFGALVNIADPTGNTPLHFASEFGAVAEVLEVLVLEGGADPTLKNKKGLTPLDVSKTAEIKNKLTQLETERKSMIAQHNSKHAGAKNTNGSRVPKDVALNRTRSLVSSVSGTIRPFDSASHSHYPRFSSTSFMTRSVSRTNIASFLFRTPTTATTNNNNSNDEDHNTNSSSKQQKFMAAQKQLLMASIQRKKKDQNSSEYSDFQIIMKAFFGYQTSFTTSIESSLAYITDSILNGSWQQQAAIVQSLEISTGSMTTKQSTPTLQHLEKTIAQLRYELREAHEMFDTTDELVERVMLAFREELEHVEQVHQADWELSELQHDKVEKLFDVFERIDNRFVQLELAQDDLIQQVERLRKAAARRHQQQLRHQQESAVATLTAKVDEIGYCVVHLYQSLFILQAVPVDHILLHLHDDRSRLCRDMEAVVEQTLAEIERHEKQAGQTAAKDHKKLHEAKSVLEKQWAVVKELLTKEGSNSPDTRDNVSVGSSSSSTVVGSLKSSSVLKQKFDAMSDLYSFLPQRQYHHYQRHSRRISTNQQQSPLPSLNQLELSFDILQSNLSEIQKDIDNVTEHLSKLTESKKKMYELCLQLEKELHGTEQQQPANADPKKQKRSAEEIKSDLNHVLRFTQRLFDKQHSLEKEREQLIKEQNQTRKRIEKAKTDLSQVRPHALLQGLLDRLDTDEETPVIRIEKDWKEDPHLVAEIILEDDDSSSSSSASSASLNRQQQQKPQDDTLTALQFQQLNDQCTSPLATLCYIARLDASLYCLKVLAAYLITKSRQNLLQVQGSLGQASTDLDETRNRMTQLYDNAAEVARQVFALKTELETIVRHRKEEVVKVWEVVNEVSEGLEARIQQQQQHQQVEVSKELPPLPSQQQQQPKRGHSLQSLAEHGDSVISSSHASPKDFNMEENQDHYQWIIRELEQLYHVYESLQDAIEDLKREQTTVGENLRDLATSFIEPQVDKLVGQSDTSLLSVSDQLAELMDRIRENDLGLRQVSFWSFSSSLIADESNDTTRKEAAEQESINKKKLASMDSASNASLGYAFSRRISMNGSSTATKQQRLSVSTFNSGSNLSASYVRRSPSSIFIENNKRLSSTMTIRTTENSSRKRMSVISTTSLSSLSSYQQERMMARASNLSNALSKVQQQQNTSSNKSTSSLKQ